MSARFVAKQLVAWMLSQILQKKDPEELIKELTVEIYEAADELALRCGFAAEWLKLKLKAEMQARG